MTGTTKQGISVVGLAPNVWAILEGTRVLTTCREKETATKTANELRRLLRRGER